MTEKSHIKPLGKRQIFTMKRASLEKRVNEYHRKSGRDLSAQCVDF